LWVKIGDDGGGKITEDWDKITEDKKRSQKMGMRRSEESLKKV